MATNTDVPIYAATLATNTSSITVDLSTYQQYANLKIVVTGRDSRTESNDGFGLTFNSDNSTGSTNYSDTFMYAANATTYSGRNSNYRQINLHQLNAANGSSTYFPVSIVHVLNYSNPNMYKTVLNSGGVTDEVYTATGTWRNNAPITSMTLWPGYNGSGYIFYAGTSIAVYGIGLASTGAKATGGAIYSDANYMYHVFGSTGTFTPLQSLTATAYVVAGGGGGSCNFGGGGGGGGVVTSSPMSLTTTGYTVTVGAGGARGYNYVQATDGGSSSFNGTSANPGIKGGNGGEAGGNSGNGYTGGAGYYPGPPSVNGGGGAGASMNGYAATSGTGPKGGDGLVLSLWESYAVGGGGNGGQGGTGANAGWGPNPQVYPTTTSIGGGGLGGGGSNPGPGQNGLALRGGGGGGGTWDNSVGGNLALFAGGNGGSGVVIVRYAK